MWVRGDPLLGAADTGEVDAVEEHRELAALQPSPERTISEGRKTKASLLETLVEQDEAAAVPGQHLGAVATPAHEDEEVASVEILLPLVADDGGQPIDAVAHVDGLGGEENPDRPREEEHYRRARSSSARYRSSVPAGSRTTTPPVSAISTAAPRGRASGAAEPTTSKGRKDSEILAADSECFLAFLYIQY